MQPDNADTLYALGKAAFNFDAGVAEESLTRVTELETEHTSGGASLPVACHTPS